MFKDYVIKEEDNEQKLYLFIDYSYEFGSLGKLNNGKKKNIYDQAINYLKSHKINFEGSVVYLVLNGLIIGSILLNRTNISLNEDTSIEYDYVGQVASVFKVADFPSVSNDVIKDFISDNNETIIPSTEQIKEEIQTPSQPPPTSNTQKEVTKPVIPKAATPAPPAPAFSPAPPAPAFSPPPPVVEEPALPVNNEVMVTLYRSTGIIETISLEDYIIGVVGAEMPASFHSEALKAQSVAARTYTLKMVKENKVLTDTTTHQVYKDNNQLKNMWGSSFTTYYNKIKDAVMTTKGEYISYNNYYIDAVYHSTNNGKTESSIDVFGNSYPYLISVDSHWDLSATSYLRETTLEFATINTLLGINISYSSMVEVVSKTSGDKIDIIQIDDTSFTGKTVREKLSLRSTDFDIILNQSTATIVTRGYGHGVGMSQYGSNGMAKEGYSYRNILSHYYTGTVIKSVN